VGLWPRCKPVARADGGGKDARHLDVIGMQVGI